ncbi:anti-sigma factor antagonist [bacterium]|nr:anti-sigma factor antagonist [bacterium]
MTTEDGEFRVETIGNLAIISAEGELDDFQAPKLQEAFVKFKLTEYPHVIVDLEKTTFVDSVGLGVIVSHAKQMPPNGMLTIVTTRPQIMRLIDTSGILNAKRLHIQVARSIEEAKSLIR